MTPRAPPLGAPGRLGVLYQSGFLRSKPRMRHRWGYTQTAPICRYFLLGFPFRPRARAVRRRSGGPRCTSGPRLVRWNGTTIPDRGDPRMSIGPAEIVIVLILALLVFGPKRLPQMGKSLGKGVREFRKAAETGQDRARPGRGDRPDQRGQVDDHRAHQGGHRHLHRPQVQRRPQVGHRGAGRGDRRGGGRRRPSRGAAERDRLATPRRRALARTRGGRVRRGPGDAAGHAADGVRRRPAPAAAARSPAASAGPRPRGAGRARVRRRPGDRRLVRARPATGA